MTECITDSSLLSVSIKSGEGHEGVRQRKIRFEQAFSRHSSVYGIFIHGVNEDPK